MAKIIHTLARSLARVLGRRLPLAGTALLLGTVGCAFPHGTTQGDPILGNFNRPIVATPMPERGGIGSSSPAYDGGARIGAGAPEVPTALENTSGFMSLPQLSSPSILSGARMPFAMDDSVAYNRRMPNLGARLPMPNEGPNRVPAVPSSYVVPPQGSATAVAARPSSPVTLLTAGSSITPTPTEGEVKQAKYQSPREMVRVQSVEEGQTMLTNMGAKWQSLQQVENEWLFTCTLGTKQYEAKSPDRIQALRAVIETIQSEK